MKIIVFNDDGSKRSNRVAWALSDNAVVTVTTDHIEFTDGDRHEIIGDMNSRNASVIDGVDLPVDYKPSRFTYANDTFTEVPGWVDPLVRLNASKLEGMTAAEIITAASTLGINLSEV